MAFKKHIVIALKYLVLMYLMITSGAAISIVSGIIMSKYLPNTLSLILANVFFILNGVLISFFTYPSFRENKNV